MKKSKWFSRSSWPGVISISSGAVLMVLLAVFLRSHPFQFITCAVMLVIFIFSWMVYSGGGGYFFAPKLCLGKEYRLVSYFAKDKNAYLEEIDDETNQALAGELFFGIEFGDSVLPSSGQVYVALKVFGDGGTIKLYPKPIPKSPKL